MVNYNTKHIVHYNCQSNNAMYHLQLFFSHSFVVQRLSVVGYQGHIHAKVRQQMESNIIKHKLSHSQYEFLQTTQLLNLLVV